MLKNKNILRCGNCNQAYCNSKNTRHSTVTDEQKSTFFNNVEIGLKICGDCESEYGHRGKSGQENTIRNNKCKQ